MGRAIQASEIAARIGRTTREAIERLYPDPYDPAAADAGEIVLREWRRHTPSATAGAPRAGYVTDVSFEHLLDVLDSQDVRVHVPVMPGDFVTAATTVVSVWAPEPVTPQTRASLGAAISVANERHLALDAGYGARQLADVVLRALSPGTNDPTTADTCIGYLRDILELLAGRAMPAEVLRLEPRRVTVVRRRRSFEDWLDASFGEIARFAAANTRIVASVLTALEGVANEALRVGAEDRLRAVSEIADHVATAALEAATSERDRRIVARHSEAILAIAALRGVR